MATWADRAELVLGDWDKGEQADVIRILGEHYEMLVTVKRLVEPIRYEVSAEVLDNHYGNTLYTQTAVCDGFVEIGETLQMWVDRADAEVRPVLSVS